MENYLKLRIFIYGNNALDDILNINKTIDIRLSVEPKYKIKPYLGIDKKFKWEYFIFQSEINEDANKSIKNYLLDHNRLDNIIKRNDEIKKIISEHSNDENNEQINKEISNILLKYRNFNDILVISVDNLLDKNSQLAFKYFQAFSKFKSQQPFILFLTKKENNPKIIDLFKYVTNEFFDKRNVYSLKFPGNEEEIRNINNFFIKCMNYYHEIDNYEINKQISTFNILICGPCGAGKSTFINQFMHDKIAKEGEGLSITNKIKSYIHPKYPIKIFDTPGFEDELTIKIVKREIENFDKDMIDSNRHLDLILYFNTLGERIFYAFEMELIEWLFTENKKIIFVFNDFQGNKKNKIKKLSEVIKDNIKKIISTIPKEKQNKLNIEDILNNISVIKLSQSLCEYVDNEGNNRIKIAQCYGMDSLFTKIYNLFNQDKISTYEIENTKNTEEIIDKIKKIKSFEKITNFINFHINKKLQVSKLILSYSYQDYFVWLMKDKRRNELIDKINILYKGDKIFDIDELREELKIKVDKIEDKNIIINEYLKSIIPFKNILENDGYYLDSSKYNETTFLIGYLFSSQYLNKYNQNFINLKNSLKEYCTSFNKAIDGINELSKEWKIVYESLNIHKSDSEWINKFFIVDLPKDID